MKRTAAALAAIIAAVALAGCGTTTSTGSTPAAATSSIGTGLGAKDASADVTVGKVTNEPTTGTSTAPVLVTNHSTGRSDYFITVVLDSADGSTQIDSTMVAVTGLEPGQKSPQVAQFMQPAPAGAVAKVTEVQRTASN